MTGDSNGNVFVWRRGYNAVTKSLKKVHNGPVFAICVLKDGSVVTGGGRDGKLIHFDANYKKSDQETEVQFLIRPSLQSRALIVGCQERRRRRI